MGTLPFPIHFFDRKGRYFEKLSWGSTTSDMTAYGLREMFEGDFADMCADKYHLRVMGGRPGSEDPIGVRADFVYLLTV